MNVDEPGRTGLAPELAGLCNSLGRLAQTETYKTTSLNGRSKVNSVVTVFEALVPVQPRTGEPLRGVTGVTLRVEGPTGWSHSTDMIQDVAFLILNPSKFNQGPEQEVREAVTSAVTSLAEKLVQEPRVRHRVYEAAGFKTYDASAYDDLLERALEKPDSQGLIGLPFVLDELIRIAVDRSGLDGASAGEVGDWNLLLEPMEILFEELRTRDYHRYEALAYVSGPAIDDLEPIVIGKVALGDGPAVAVALCAIRDTDLTDVLTYGGTGQQELPPGVADCNLVIKLDLLMSVDATLERSLEMYPQATAVVRKVVDLLRLARAEDLGVNFFTIKERSWATPGLRNDWTIDFERSTAVWYPRRMAYRPAIAEPLTASQVQLLKELAAVYLDQEVAYLGFFTAINRMRNGIERYVQTDPERLLEYSIAFEALLLNDDPRSELSFRLALRGARLLRDTDMGRREVFARLRDLYTFRSRLAHGDTLKNMKASDTAKLKAVEAETLGLLKEVCIAILRGRGPVGVQKNDLPDWWRGHVLQ